MNTRGLITSAFLLIVPSGTGTNDGGDLVNAAIGNASYHERFGAATPQASEHLRIRTHLEYVIDVLSSTNDSHLTPSMQEARRRNIDRLQSYVENGVFPRKPRGFRGRTPNFVDEDGNVCAVGYLVEQDLGRGAVAEIAAGNQLDYVPYINSSTLAKWQAKSGLSPSELAMIQPAYGDEPLLRQKADDPPDESVKLGLIYAGLAVSFMNSFYIVQGEGNKVSGVIGVGIGAASLIYNGTNEDRSSGLDAVGMFSAMLGGVSFAIRINSSSVEPKQLTVGAYSSTRYPAIAKISLEF